MAATSQQTKSQRLDQIVRSTYPSGNAMNRKPRPSLSADEFDKTLDDIEAKFGVQLDSRITKASRLIPRISRSDLISLVAAVGAGQTFQQRTVAVQRLRKIGFRVAYLRSGLRPEDAPGDPKAGGLPVKIRKGSFSVVD